MLLKQWDYDRNEGMRKLKPNPSDRWWVLPLFRLSSAYIFLCSMFWVAQPPLAIADSTTMDRIAEGDENVSVHRADITKVREDYIHLSDGKALQSDLLIYATGYSTHQPIFSVEDAKELGLPVPIDPSSSASTTSLDHLEYGSQIIERFPRLARTPPYKNPPQYTQYKLYRSVVPLPLLAKNDRSLAFVGCVQGTGMAVLSEVVALWAVAWMTDHLDIARPMHEIEREVAMLNDFAKLRYGHNGAQIPVCIMEWHSVSDVPSGILRLKLTNRIC
jgi:hypothetical protein